jgi:hypothetical protein
MRVLYARSNQLEGVVDHANLLMAGEGFREVKNVAGNRTGFLCVDGETFFIKRFRARSWIKGVLEKFRGSRASRSLRGAEILKRVISRPARRQRSRPARIPCSHRVVSACSLQ